MANQSKFVDVASRLEKLGYKTLRHFYQWNDSKDEFMVEWACPGRPTANLLIHVIGDEFVKSMTAIIPDLNKDEIELFLAELEGPQPLAAE